MAEGNLSKHEHADWCNTLILGTRERPVGRCDCGASDQVSQVATPGATVAGEDSVGVSAESSRPRELLTSKKRIHDLKCWPIFFSKLLDGSKTFEIRLNDRGFDVGDELRLREYDPATREYSGREVQRLVTYMTSFYQTFGYVVMALGSPDETSEDWKARWQSAENDVEGLQRDIAARDRTIESQRQTILGLGRTIERLQKRSAEETSARCTCVVGKLNWCAVHSERGCTTEPSTVPLTPSPGKASEHPDVPAVEPDPQPRARKRGL